MSAAEQTRPVVLGTPVRFSDAQAAAFRLVAAREAESGRHDEAVEVLRVLALLRPDQMRNWEALARQLGRTGDGPGQAAAAKIASALRVREAS